MKDEIISAEQLYKILYYSKRKTKYLLDSGVIPCKNNGKKTRCYRVKMSDVMVYLDNVKRDGDKYIFPAGMFSSNCPSRQPSKINMSEDGYRRLYGIINRALSKASDALTVDEAAAVTGYSRTLILKSIQSGDLYAGRIFAYYIIPKEKLVAFLAGKNGLAIKYKSSFHRKMLQILIEKGTKK